MTTPDRIIGAFGHVLTRDAWDETRKEVIYSLPKDADWTLYFQNGAGEYPEVFPMPVQMLPEVGEPTEHFMRHGTIYRRTRLEKENKVALYEKSYKAPA